MTTITLRDFKGELPHRAPRYLPATFAQGTADARLEDGRLAPVREARDITTLPATAETAIYHDGAWRTWNARVQAVPGPVAADRLYITGDGAPKMEVGGESYPLALPAPQIAPTVDVLIAPDSGADTFQTILFAFTWVTEFGEESAPSPLTKAAEWSEGGISLDNFPVPPSGRGINRVRLYQSQTSLTGTTELFFKGEATVGNVTEAFDGIILNDSLAEPIPTAHFGTPTATMTGLIAMPNGMMVAYDGRELLFSEPYQPHAWPDSYRIKLDHPITGLAAFGSSLAIMTDAVPYRGQGTHPDSFTTEKLEESLPCVSPDSIVDLGFAACYASTAGLVQITASGASLVTDQLMTREQWQRLDPASIVAAAYDRKYVFTFDGTLDGADERTAVIDLTGEQPFLSRWSAAPRLMYQHIQNGRLYMMDAGGALTSWDDPQSAGHRTLYWKSKLFELPYPDIFSAIEVNAEAGEGSTVSVAIYADGALLHTVTTVNAPARLPPKRARLWEIEVVSDAAISSIVMAPTLSALAGG